MTPPRPRVYRLGMIKKGLAVGLAGLSVAMTTPAQAGVDGGYQWAILKNECVKSGGNYGLGFLGIRAGNRKEGKLGVNYFKIRYERQYLTFNYSWRVDRTHTAQSASFPNANDMRYFAAPWRFPFSDSDAGKVFRMKVTYYWYKQTPGPTGARRRSWNSDPHAVWKTRCAPPDVGVPSPTGSFSLPTPDDVRDASRQVHFRTCPYHRNQGNRRDASVVVVMRGEQGAS